MSAGLSEHRIDKRGLAMVDVGDDGDVAYLFCSDHSRKSAAVGKPLY